MNGKIDTIVRQSPLMVERIVTINWNTTPKEPINFIGEPSTVKSEGVRQAAMKITSKEEREFIEWNRASMDTKLEVLNEPVKYFVLGDMRASETDIGENRLPEMKNGEDYMTFKYNILFKVLSHEDAKGILFLDELNLAPAMVKAQFYKIINDHAVGDIPLSDGVLVVSAGNEAEHARGVTEDAVPLVLRRANVHLRPLNEKEFLDYAIKTGHHRYVVGYLGFQPNHIHDVKYNVPDSIGQPCPRTWSKLSAILNANPKLSLDEIEMMATSYVGQGYARSFAAYVKSAQDIRIEDIIKNPSLIRNYEDQEDNIDMVYAIIAAIVDKYRNDKQYIKTGFELAKEFERVEFGGFLLRSMKSLNEDRFRKSVNDGRVMDDSIVKDIADKYGKYLFDERDL